MTTGLQTEQHPKQFGREQLLCEEGLMDKLQRAKELREEAARLEAEAARSLPGKWRVGMRVRFLHDKPWGWSKGQEGTVITLSDECKNRTGSQYQVFWTQPDNSSAIWWTTPNDVVLVSA